MDCAKITQYTSFVHKVERGKFRWGSKSDLRLFEQQLVYAISVDSKKSAAVKPRNTKLDDRKKYCLDFNRGKCKQSKSHEGLINGQPAFKLHVCHGA